MASHGPPIAPLSLRSSTSRPRVGLESALARPSGDIAPTLVLRFPHSHWTPLMRYPTFGGFCSLRDSPHVVSSRCELSNDFAIKKLTFSLLFSIFFGDFYGRFLLTFWSVLGSILELFLDFCSGCRGVDFGPPGDHFGRLLGRTGRSV